eukprot:403337184
MKIKHIGSITKKVSCREHLRTRENQKFLDCQVFAAKFKNTDTRAGNIAFNDILSETVTCPRMTMCQYQYKTTDGWSWRRKLRSVNQLHA